MYIKNIYIYSCTFTYDVPKDLWLGSSTHGRYMSSLVGNKLTRPVGNGGRSRPAGDLPWAVGRQTPAAGWTGLGFYSLAPRLQDSLDLLQVDHIIDSALSLYLFIRIFITEWSFCVLEIPLD
jgi:hypothetical protein